MRSRTQIWPGSGDRAHQTGTPHPRFRLNSVLGLVLAGFVLALAPLAAGLLASGQQIRNLARESEVLLVQTVRAAATAREILNRVVAMERAGRRFQIFRDDPAWEHFSQQHEALRAHIAELSDSSLSEDTYRRLAGLATYSDQLAREVATEHEAGEFPWALAEGFRELDRQVQEIVRDSQAEADAAIERLQQLGDRARRVVFWQLSALIPVGVLLAAIFTALITRPIRRLDRGIRSLAEPDVARIPRVVGPRDLRALSIRLEWVRRRLQRTERDRQRLLGQASHELKTPLSAIVEGVGLLDEELVGPLNREQAEVTGILKENVTRLQDQIETLLKYNRLRTGSNAAEYRPVAVASLVDEVLAAHRLAMRTRGIRARCQLEKGLTVNGNRDMLRTALDNLVSNAIKFSPSGECVGMFAYRDGSRIAVEVGDRGSGIDTDQQKRVFEPFYRVPGRNSAGLPGSGLGLAICRDLVRAHGGEVVLAGRSGWHTLFRITLPAHAPQEVAGEKA